jgi:hypothetical protein
LVAAAQSARAGELIRWAGLCSVVSIGGNAMTRDFAQLEKSLEHRAYLEAGQAVMAYLARKGWTGKWLFLVPDDSPLTLPAVEKITIESKGTEWNAVVEGLRNRVNVSLVLLAAYTTERIK